MNTCAVAAHYDKYTNAYLSTHGPIIQAAQHSDSDKILVQIGDELGLHESDVLLDCGSGIGYPARFLSDHFGCEVTGINISKRQLSEKHNFQTDRCKFVEFDFNELDLIDFSPTKICFLESFCHSSDPASLYRKLFKVLRPGGMLLIKDFIKKSNQYSPDHMDAVGSFYSAKFYGAHEHAKWAFDAGFEIRSIKRINLDSPSDLTMDFLNEVQDFPEQLVNSKINNTFVPVFIVFSKPEDI